MIAPYLPYIVTSGTGHDVLEATRRQGVFAGGICLVLLGISIVSWAIIIRKWLMIYRTETENEKFTDVFKQLGGDFGTILERSERCPNSSMARIFGEAYEELRQTARISNDHLVMSKQALQLVAERTERSISEVVADLEKNLVFLATSTSISPFLGLLGTVWGLLGAFGQMGASGSADISTVGVGVAEALVTTLVGLAVAIPCSLFYNYFQGKAGKMTAEMDRFASELNSRLARNLLHHQAKEEERPAVSPRRKDLREEAIAGARNR